MERVNCILRHEDYCAIVNEIKQHEKDRRFCLHDMEHFLSVARLMQLCANEQGLPLPRDILYATALLHDIGRAEQYRSGTVHAKAAEVSARAILADCHFTPEEMEAITKAICAHSEKNTQDALSALLYQADKLSRNCFCCAAADECYWPETQKNQGVSI